MTIRDIERDKYERVWAVPAYSDFSPGERMVDAFASVVKPKRFKSVIDFGAGGGAAAKGLRELGLTVHGVDHVDHGREHYDGFTKSCLWDMPAMQRAMYGYCVDVMEHIPIEYTMLTIRQILDRCDSAFFQICTKPDSFGKEIGEPLHLTVAPYQWWLHRLEDLGEVHDARDLMWCGMYHVGG